MWHNVKCEAWQKKVFFPFPYCTRNRNKTDLNKGKGWNFASDEDVYVCCA